MWRSLYQQDPPSIIDSEWPSEFFSDDIFFDEWPDDSQLMCKVISVDPSLGKTDHCDYSAIIMAAQDYDDCFWVDADIRRRPSSELVSDTIGWHKAFDPVAYSCEVNQFQQLLLDSFEEEARARGEYTWPLGLTNHLPKMVRIRSLTPLLAKKQIRFKRHSPGVSLLMEQLKGFPSHKFDDGPDALEMAVRLTDLILTGVAELPAR